MKEEDINFAVHTLAALKSILGSDLFGLTVFAALIAGLYYAKLYIDKNFSIKKKDAEDTESSDNDSTQFQDTRGPIANTNTVSNTGGNIAINVNGGNLANGNNSEHDEIIDGLELASKLTLNNVDLSDKYHEAKQKHIDEVVKNHALSGEIKDLKGDLKSIHRMLITFSIKENSRREYDGYIRDIIEIIEEKIPELRTDRKRKERSLRSSDNGMEPFRDSERV